MMIGYAWWQVPFDFPPWRTACWCFVRWEEAKATDQVHAVLRCGAPVVQGARRGTDDGHPAAVTPCRSLFGGGRLKNKHVHAFEVIYMRQKVAILVAALQRFLGP